MDQHPSHSALEASAAVLRGIWAAMWRQFGMFGVEPSRQVATSRWCIGIFRRFGALLARYQTGRLRRHTVPRVVSTGRKIVNKPQLRMPRTWGWLVVTGTHHAAGYGTQMEALLQRPEMAALLEVSPQARRVLRPLLRALAVTLPWVVDQPRVERPRQPRKPRRKPEPFKHPLPRGLLTRARRDRALDKAIKLKQELVFKMATKSAI